MSNEQNKKRSVKERAIQELRRFAVLSIYLWIFLSTLEIHRTLVLRGAVSSSELSYRTGFALVKALVLAKFMLVAETVVVIRAFRDKALVYSILFRSAVYAAILVGMDILEEVVVAMFHGKAAAQGVSEVGGGGVEGIILVGIMAFVLLIPLFAFRAIADAIGPEQMKLLLLKKGRTSTAP
jgi:hypothetical protein